MAEKCMRCPRKCLIDREKNKGYCGEKNSIRASRAALHFWEEPCISGDTGSGTVFFSGCSLKCVFCQNYALSQSETGFEVTAEQLSEIFLKLQGKNAANINLVTPSHFVDEIIPAILLARKNGLTVPIVYNTGSYETVENIRKLDGIVDIYLPDLKFFSPEISGKYANAPDYFETASLAIKEMVRQTGKPVFSEKTFVDSYGEEIHLMKRGTIVRHMLLPGHVNDSKKIISYLYETYGDDIFISIMNQYTPILHTGSLSAFPLLTRSVTKREYEKVISHALSIGVENAFFQDGKTDEKSFIPSFDGEGILE